MSQPENMKISIRRFLMLSLIGTACVVLYLTRNGVARAITSPGYRLTSTMRLGGEGGWDYVTFDPTDKFLYVTRTTHTMVVNAATGKIVHDITGQERSHGVA